MGCNTVKYPGHHNKAVAILTLNPVSGQSLSHSRLKTKEIHQAKQSIWRIFPLQFNQLVWFYLTAKGNLATISLIIYSLWKKKERSGPLWFKCPTPSLLCSTVPNGNRTERWWWRSWKKETHKANGMRNGFREVLADNIMSQEYLL